jgi:hypothetical protein
MGPFPQGGTSNQAPNQKPSDSQDVDQLFSQDPKADDLGANFKNLLPRSGQVLKDSCLTRMRAFGIISASAENRTKFSKFLFAFPKFVCYTRIFDAGGRYILPKARTHQNRPFLRHTCIPVFPPIASGLRRRNLPGERCLSDFWQRLDH